MKHLIDHSPLISVIIPVFNVEPYLRRGLDSVCNQSYRNLEIICVNDGSTDNSLEILREYEQKDPRVRVLTQENAGVASARNRALDIATGEWVTGMDPDDWVVEDGYESVLVQASDDADLLYIGSEVLVEGDGVPEERVEDMRRYMARDLQWEGLVEWEPAMLFNTTCTVNKFFKRSIITDKALRYNEALWNASDFCFFFEYGAHVNRAFFTRKRIYNYCLRKTSITFLKERENLFRRLSSHLLLLEHIFQHYTQHNLVRDFLPQLKTLIQSSATRVYQHRVPAGGRNEWTDKFVETIRRCGIEHSPDFAKALHTEMEKMRGGRLVEQFVRDCRDYGNSLPPAAEGSPAQRHIATVAGDATLLPCVITLQSIADNLAADGSLCVHVVSNSLSPFSRGMLGKISRPGMEVRVHEVHSDLLPHMPGQQGAEPHAWYLAAALPELLPQVERCLFVQAGMLLRPEAQALPSHDFGDALVAALPLSDRERAGKLCKAMQNREWWRYLTVRHYYEPSLLWLDLKGMREAEASMAWLDASLMRYEDNPYPMHHALNLALQDRLAALPPTDTPYAVGAEGHHALSEPKAPGPASLIPRPDTEHWAEWIACFEKSPLSLFPLKDLLPSSAQKSEASALQAADIAALSLHYGKIKGSYRRYRLLACLTWGKRRQHYSRKKRECRHLLEMMDISAHKAYLKAKEL